MKKVRLILICIILCIIFSASVSFAFIIKETTSNNVITFGNIKMELLVTTLENGKQKKVNDSEKIDVTYNPNINRNIIIKNISNHPMFVRVSIDLKGQTKDGKQIDNLDFVDIISDSDNWIYQDNWYYYESSIDENVVTNDLTIDLKFDINKITSKYPGSTFTLDINAEAVQSENNKDNVLEALGWPSN